MKKLVVLTGAGMSAESGISTFRDSGGLWEQHNIEDVATPQGWMKNPQLVLDFYNARRAQLIEASPNEGHLGLAHLEEEFDVHIITQNIDNLHERAGSTKVLHLHGELTKACNEHKTVVKEIGHEPIKIGDMVGNTQARPFIVWFGEDVPAMGDAIEITEQADVFVVIGTSLNVYPAAGLLNFVKADVSIFLIDPNENNAQRKVNFIQNTAVGGVEKLRLKLKNMV